MVSTIASSSRREWLLANVRIVLTLCSAAFSINVPAIALLVVRACQDEIAAGLQKSADASCRIEKFVDVLHYADARDCVEALRDSRMPNVVI